MTIKELIAILEIYQLNTEVMVYNQQGAYYDPPEINDWVYDKKNNLLILS